MVTLCLQGINTREKKHHTCNSCPWEGQAGGSLQMQCYPGPDVLIQQELHGDTMSQESKYSSMIFWLVLNPMASPTMARALCSVANPAQILPLILRSASPMHVTKLEWTGVEDSWARLHGLNKETHCTQLPSETAWIRVSIKNKLEWVRFKKREFTFPVRKIAVIQFTNKMHSFS